MSTIQQYFGFHDRYQSALLAKRCVARQSMGIGFEASICRNSLADGNDCTPFGELGTELLIFLNPSPKSVEPLGYNFAGKARNIYGPFIHFDAGHDALL